MTPSMAVKAMTDCTDKRAVTSFPEATETTACLVAAGLIQWLGAMVRIGCLEGLAMTIWTAAQAEITSKAEAGMIR